MNRKTVMMLLAVGVISGGLAAGPVMAGARAEDIMAQLKQQGYVNLQTETTWLGRVRITANTSKGGREIVINPGTGEILRDLWIPVDGGAAPGDLISDAPKAGDSGDDDGSDSSGSGSSGSGSSGSDDGSDGSDDHGGSGHDSGGDSGGSGGGGDGGGNDD